MYLSKIHIENYKCLKDTTIEFDDGVNSIVGKNGVGKTAIIEAVKYVLFGMVNLASPVPTDATVEFTIFDNDNYLGKRLYELLKRETVPPAYLKLFSDAFQSSGSPASFTFSRNKDYFFFGINDVIFVSRMIMLHKNLRNNTGNEKHINAVKIEETGNAATLSDFVNNTTKDCRLVFSLEYCNSAFNVLRSCCFFINEMRDLQGENRERETHIEKKAPDEYLLPMKADDADPNQLLASTISSATFMSKLNELNKSKKPEDNIILTDFRVRCEVDDRNLRIDPLPGSSTFDLNDRISTLRIYDTLGKRVLTNEAFPSGILEKIFFNFALAYSQNGILFIEEPETHMHPLMQKTFLSELKQRKGQTIITTHSPEFVGFDLRIIKITAKGDERKIAYYSVKNEDANVHRGFYELDKRIFFSDMALFVEGESEDILLQEILDEIQSGNYLSKRNVLLINAGGDSKGKMFHKVLQHLKFPNLFVLDSKGRQANKVADGRFAYDGNDFDKLYSEEAKKTLKYSNENNKANFALSVLLDHYRSRKPLNGYFTPAAWESFKKLMECVKAEIERNA